MENKKIHTNDLTAIGSEPAFLSKEKDMAVIYNWFNYGVFSIDNDGNTQENKYIIKLIYNNDESSWGLYWLMINKRYSDKNIKKAIELFKEYLKEVEPEFYKTNTIDWRN